MRRNLQPPLAADFVCALLRLGILLLQCIRRCIAWTHCRECVGYSSTVVKNPLVEGLVRWIDWQRSGGAQMVLYGRRYIMIKQITGNVSQAGWSNGAESYTKSGHDFKPYKTYNLLLITPIKIFVTRLNTY